MVVITHTTALWVLIVQGINSSLINAGPYINSRLMHDLTEVNANDTRGASPEGIRGYKHRSSVDQT